MKDKTARNTRQTYATVEEEGVNYREIADTMTALGFKMNHSSARNYVLRIMRKFADAIIREWDINTPDEERMKDIIKSPEFQAAICDVLQTIESKDSSRRRQ